MTEIQATCGAVLIWASFFRRSSPCWEHSVNYSVLLGQVLYCWIFTMQCFKDTKNINSISSPLHWKLGLFPECSRSGWATADVRYDRERSKLMENKKVTIQTLFNDGVSQAVSQKFCMIARFIISGNTAKLNIMKHSVLSFRNQAIKNVTKHAVKVSSWNGN